MHTRLIALFIALMFAGVAQAGVAVVVVESNVPATDPDKTAYDLLAISDTVDPNDWVSAFDANVRSPAEGICQAWGWSGQVGSFDLFNNKTQYRQDPAIDANYYNDTFFGFAASEVLESGILFNEDANKQQTDQKGFGTFLVGRATIIGAYQSQVTRIAHIVLLDGKTAQVDINVAYGVMETGWQSFVIPEPASVALLGAGAAVVLVRRRRK